MESNNRGQWKSNFGFLMAAIGSAVGLGNIWGFPFKMGSNGGFAFLLVYIVMAALVGFTIMLGEFGLGRRTGKSSIATYRILSKRFKWLGWPGFISAFLILSFYCVLGGYCIKYVVVNVSELFGAGYGGGGAIFGELTGNMTESLVYTLIFVILNAVIVMGGISGGIERFSKVAMPALFVMLIIIIIRSVTLDGALEGVAFMFKPNFEPFRENFLGVVAKAGGQMFFSLSIGVGTMLTYGSYLRKEENLEKNCVLIVIADTIVALMAGLAVIPASFAMGGADAAMAGPGLLFITLQDVFRSMGAVGPVFGTIFYLLVVIAAVTSSISIIEIITTFYLDNAEMKGKTANRRKVTVITCVVVMALASIVAVDGMGGNGIWIPFQNSLGVIGSFNDCWIDFMDFWAEGIFMPLSAMFMCIFIGYEFGVDKFGEELELCGNRFASRGFFRICCKVIAPAAMVLIFLGQIDSIFALHIFG